MKKFLVTYHRSHQMVIEAADEEAAKFLMCVHTENGCLANRFTALVADVSAREIPAYPAAYDAGKALNAASEGKGRVWPGCATGASAPRRRADQQTDQRDAGCAIKSALLGHVPSRIAIPARRASNRMLRAFDSSKSAA